MSLRPASWFFVAACGLLFLLGLRLSPSELPAGSVALPELGGRPLELDEAAREILGVQSWSYREFIDDAGLPLWVYAGYYAALEQDAQIHAPEHCYPGAGYSVEERTSRNDRTELLVTRGADRRLVWYQYRTRRGVARGAFALKRDMVLVRLQGGLADGLLMRVSTPLREAEPVDRARARLEALWPSIDSVLGEWYGKLGER